MNIHAFFIIPKNSKQCQCPSTSEQISKLWYNHTMKNILATEKNKHHTQQPGWTSKRSCRVWVEAIREKNNTCNMTPLIKHSVQAYLTRQSRSSLPRDGNRYWGWKFMWQLSGDMNIVIILITVIVLWVYISVKIYQIGNLKYSNLVYVKKHNKAP